MGAKPQTGSKADCEGAPVRKLLCPLPLALAITVQRGPRCQGTALLPWVGVLAVLAILFTFLLPALIREIDFRVARDESAALKSFGNALQSATQRHGCIPSQTNWAQMVAAETGLELGLVTINRRHQQRILLIDSSGWFTNAALTTDVTLPYTQTAFGTTNLPVNARLMIASSLGKALPLSAGPLSASEFAALWNAAEGTTSFPTTGLWAGWNGRSGDVKVERMNLSPLFVSLRVITYTPPTNAPQGFDSIGDNNNLIPAPYLNDKFPQPPRYYLQNTVLRLYRYDIATSTVHLDSTQVLTQDGSFMYQNGNWKSSASGGSMPGGVDIAGVVYAFLNAVPNTLAQYGADQQRLVAQAMMSYMSNYIAWADAGFPADATWKSYLLSVQRDMIATVQGLFQGPYYPANASGPQ